MATPMVAGEPWGRLQGLANVYSQADANNAARLGTMQEARGDDLAFAAKIMTSGPALSAFGGGQIGNLATSQGNLAEGMLSGAYTGQMDAMRMAAAAPRSGGGSGGGGGSSGAPSLRTGLDMDPGSSAVLIKDKAGNVVDQTVVDTGDISMLDRLYRNQGYSVELVPPGTITGGINTVTGGKGSADNPVQIGQPGGQSPRTLQDMVNDSGGAMQVEGGRVYIDGEDMGSVSEFE